MKRLGISLLTLAVSFLFGCGGVTPATLDFLDFNPTSPRLGQDTVVRFIATDVRGLPQAGLRVTFEVQSPSSNVKLQSTSAQTGKDGVVQTTVTASGRVSSVVIVAKAGDKTALSKPLTFAGTVPSARWFTLQCGRLAGPASGGIHAVGAWDPMRTLIAGVKLDCSAHVGDRNGDGVEGISVSFETEAGAMTPTGTTISDVVGNVDLLYKTSDRLPIPTDPGVFSWTPSQDATHTGDYLVPLWMHPSDWYPNPYLPASASNKRFNEPQRNDPVRQQIDGSVLINNPRDNLVTMIALTTGEEGFDDDNNNGVYDEGEKYEDLTEPFVDANDNGTWDKGETFVDIDGDGKWSGKNGKWDGNGTIWTANKILWTGYPAPADFAPNDATAPTVKQLSFVPALADGLNKYGSMVGSYNVADPWWNTIARNGESDGCSTVLSSPTAIMEAQTGVGIRLTYPPFETIGITISDSRDPNNSPEPPNYATAVSFTVAIGCQYTGSPNAGQVVKIPLPSVTSKFNN